MCDRYTKVVLTVIAACLVWICVRDVPLTSEVYGQSARARAQRMAQQRKTQGLQQSDKDKIEEATPVKLIAVDETVFKSWPESKSVPVPFPVLVQGGHINVRGHVDATPYFSPYNSGNFFSNSATRLPLQ